MSIESLEALNFCKPLKELYQRGEVVLPGGATKPISSASTLNNLLTIRALIQANRPKATLEIGLAFGASALTMLSSMAEFTEGEHRHTAIDPFQSSTWKSVAEAKLNDAGYSDRFRFIEGFSCFVLPELCQDKEKFDLIYVDGSHIFEDVFIDLFYSARLLSSGGHLLFDDCTDSHVRKVISFIDKNFQAILERVEVDLGTKKTLKRRVGHKLGYRQLVVYRKRSDPPRSWDAGFKNF